MHAACMSLSPLAWYQSMVNNVDGCRLQDGQLIIQIKIAVVVDPAILSALYGHEPIRAKRTVG